MRRGKQRVSEEESRHEQRLSEEEEEGRHGWGTLLVSFPYDYYSSCAKIVTVIYFLPSTVLQWNLWIRFYRGFVSL